MADPTATNIDPRKLDPLKPLPYPPAQRYEVSRDGVGPWRAGDVLQGDDELAGANLHPLLAGGAIAPTDKPRTHPGQTGHVGQAGEPGKGAP